MTTGLLIVDWLILPIELGQSAARISRNVHCYTGVRQGSLQSLLVAVAIAIGYTSLLVLSSRHRPDFVGWAVFLGRRRCFESKAHRSGWAPPIFLGLVLILSKGRPVEPLTLTLTLTLHLRAKVPLSITIALTCKLAQGLISLLTLTLANWSLCLENPSGVNSTVWGIF